MYIVYTQYIAQHFHLIQSVAPPTYRMKPFAYLIYNLQSSDCIETKLQTVYNLEYNLPIVKCIQNMVQSTNHPPLKGQLCDVEPPQAAWDSPTVLHTPHQGECQYSTHSSTLPTLIPILHSHSHEENSSIDNLCFKRMKKEYIHFFINLKLEG